MIEAKSLLSPDKLRLYREALQTKRHTFGALGGCALALFGAAYMHRPTEETASAIPASAQSVYDGSPAPKPPTFSRFVFGNHLRPITELPAFNLPVTAEQKQELLDSTLKIYLRGPDNSLVGMCTAEKVRYEDKTFIMSARHCLTNGSYSWTSPQQFEFYDPKTIPNTVYPVARARQIILDAGQGDYALFEVDANSDPVPSFSQSRTYDEVPALAYRPDFSPDLPGMQEALSGAPNSNNNHPTPGTGILLGRVTDIYNRKYDDTAVKASANAVPCNPGSSGSIEESADSHNSGPLSAVSNLSKDQAPVWRAVEDKLRVSINTKKFNYLCFYSTKQKKDFDKLVSGLG